MSAPDTQPGGAVRPARYHTDAAPVARLLRKWHRMGISYGAVCRQTGLSTSVIREVLNGTRRTVHWETVARLTGMDVDKARRDSGRRHMDALASVRMLRALSAIGHTNAAMAAEVGISYQHLSELVNDRRPFVWRCTQDEVRRVYDAWSMTPGPSRAARTRAARRGWAPPLAWEYLDMADPEAVPRGYRNIDRTTIVT